MPLFYRMVLIYSSSLSDEMLCSMYGLFYPFPKDNNSTAHPTVTRVITKKTDPSHKPRLDGHVRILRGAIFLQLPQMYHRIFWSSVIDVTGSAGFSFRACSPGPVLLHLTSKTAFVQEFYFHVTCISLKTRDGLMFRNPRALKIPPPLPVEERWHLLCIRRHD